MEQEYNLLKGCKCCIGCVNIRRDFPLNKASKSKATFCQEGLRQEDKCFRNNKSLFSHNGAWA